MNCGKMRVQWQLNPCGGCLLRISSGNSELGMDEIEVGRWVSEEEEGF